MHVVYLNAEPLYLYIRVVFLNLIYPFGNELLEGTFQDLLSILRYPHYMKLMVVCTMRTESYLHASISWRPANHPHIQP
jgi:hypothetical protein